MITTRTHARTHAVRTTIIYSFWLDACVPSNQQRAARCNSLFFFPDRHIQQLTTTARRPPSPSLTRTGNLLNLSLCCCWTLARQYPLAKRDGWPGGSVEIIGAPHHIPSSSLGVELTITISRSAGAVSESTVALFCGGRNWSERGQCGVGLSGKGRSRPSSISTTPCAPRPSQGSSTLAGVYYRNFTHHATQHFSTEICNNPISITLLSDPPYQGLITCDPDLAQSRKIPPPLTKLR